MGNVDSVATLRNIVTSYTSKEIVWGARFCHKSVLDRVGMINIASNHTFTIPYNPMRGKSGVLE